MFQTWNKTGNGDYLKILNPIPSSQSHYDLKDKPHTNFRHSFYDGFDFNPNNSVPSRADNDIFFITNNSCNIKPCKNPPEFVIRPPILPPRRNRFEDTVNVDDYFKHPNLNSLQSTTANRARLVKSATRRNRSDLSKDSKSECQTFSKQVFDSRYMDQGKKVNNNPVLLNSAFLPPLNAGVQNGSNRKSTHGIPYGTQNLEEFFQTNSRHNNNMTKSMNYGNRAKSRSNHVRQVSAPIKNEDKPVETDKMSQSMVRSHRREKKRDIPESKSAFDFRTMRQNNDFLLPSGDANQGQMRNFQVAVRPNVTNQVRKITNSHTFNNTEDSDPDWMCGVLKNGDIFQAHKNVETNHLLNIRSLNHFLKNPEPPHRTAAYTHEEFLKALSEEVCNGDPRKHLEEVALIGEGSTAEVVLAKYKPGAIEQLNKMNQNPDGSHSSKQNFILGTCKTLKDGHFSSPKDGDFVAIKKMKIRKQQRRELLFNEIIIMRSYPHPNIVQMHSSYLVGNELWVFMEYIEGGALTNIVTEKTMEEVQIACVVKSVLLALAFLHDHGVIHRDIKSDSILLKVDGTVKLSDFGFSACITPEVPRRRSLVGTPYWMAPEVLARESYNTAIDVWSTGVLIIEMVDGEPSFFNMSPFKVMKIIKEKLIPSLKNPNKSSPMLNSMLSLMLVRNFNQRATTSQLLRHPFIATAAHQSCLIPLISTKQYK